jgi:hypothetical protein
VTKLNRMPLDSQALGCLKGRCRVPRRSSGKVKRD